MAAKRGSMFGDLRPHILDIDVPGIGALHDDDLQPGHDRTRGVGAVRTAGDQAHRAIVVTARPVIAADGQQTRELPLRAGVGLHTDPVVAGHLGQPPFHVGDHLTGPFGLVDRRERVQTGELRPGHRLHLRGGVQLHRAGAQRDHRPVEGQILVRQPPQIPHHGGLVVIAAELRVVQQRAAPQQLRRDRTDRAHPRRVEDLEDRVDVGVGCHLVAGDTDGAVQQSQIEAASPGPLDHGRGVVVLDHHGVEEGSVSQLQPVRTQGRGQHAGMAVDPLRDGTQSVRAVVLGVERGDQCEQDLGRADVGGGPVAADVLFAGLQRQS